MFYADFLVYFSRLVFSIGQMDVSRETLRLKIEIHVMS